MDSIGRVRWVAEPQDVSSLLALIGLSLNLQHATLSAVLNIASENRGKLEDDLRDAVTTIKQLTAQLNAEIARIGEFSKRLEDGE